MIGIYRFLLAQTVVMSHFGGISSQVSQLAVYSFYMVSGFLIMRVLDTRYAASGMATKGITAFYANRVLKIFPLYIVIVCFSLLLQWLHPSPFGVEGGTLPVIPVIPEETSFANWFFFIPTLQVVGGLPILTFGTTTTTVPQIWSVGVELCWYLIAPLVLLLTRRNMRWLFGLVAGGCIFFLFALYHTLGLTFSDTFGTPMPERTYLLLFYKSFHSGLPLFLCGAITYWLQKRIVFRFDAGTTLLLLLIYFWYLLFWSQNSWLGHQPTIAKLLCDIALAFAITMMMIFTRAEGQLKTLDHKLGELSYGIYVNQFVIAFGMMWAVEFFGRNYNLSSIFGASYNRLEFGIHAAVFSTFFAYITYHLVEMPVERIRKKLRRVS